MADTKKVEYKCKKCGAHDSVALFHHEAPPPVINCWKCRAGRGMAIQDMINKGQGMFMVPVHIAVVNV